MRLYGALSLSSSLPPTTLTAIYMVCETQLLYSVLVINSGFILVQTIGGLGSHSLTLLTDSIEGLADCITYVFNLMIEKQKKSAWAKQAVQFDMLGALVSVAVLVLLHLVLAFSKFIHSFI